MKTEGVWHVEEMSGRKPEGGEGEKDRGSVPADRSLQQDNDLVGFFYFTSNLTSEVRGTFF